ncbi:hypothetical protein MPER_09755 [Moniliophthora perniciosa FA553]|nr:hypothetical protein MPER_09755 [Moniliophthora perniciosa FA553]
MIFAPAVLLFTLSSLSTIRVATAAPHLTARLQGVPSTESVLGFIFPAKCRDQCEPIDGAIINCEGGSIDKYNECRCTNDMLGRVSKCFVCIVTETKDQEPDGEQTLQGAMDTITGTCNAAGFNVNPQTLTASGNGGVGLNREAALKMSALGVGMGLLMLAV